MPNVLVFAALLLPATVGVFGFLVGFRSLGSGFGLRVPGFEGLGLRVPGRVSAAGLCFLAGCGVQGSEGSGFRV